MGIPLLLCDRAAKSILLTLLFLRCNVIVGRIDLESGRSVAKEGGLYFLPAVHILLSSLDGFDMAHILEKSSGSGNSNQSPPPPFSLLLLKPFFNAQLPPKIPLRTTVLLIAEKC